MKTRCGILFVLCLALLLGHIISISSHLETSVKLDVANTVIEQHDTVIDALETRCRLQVRDIKMWEAKNLALVKQFVKHFVKHFV